MTLTTETSTIAPPAGLPRLLGPDTHPHWRAAPPGRSPQELIDAVARSGLRGRGGAGFPTATKLAAVASASRKKPVVVANACEGEPASAKDRTLLATSPHLVLDGAALAGWAVGATEIILCVDRHAAASRDAVMQARAERPHDRLPIRIETPPSRYIAGEESALVHWLNGGDAKPTFTPPRPYQKGVNGRPTLIQNVETLAHLALIGRFGDEWFRTLGTAAEPGSLLLTVSGAVDRPGVLEAALGTPLDAILAASSHRSQPSQNHSPMLVGGYFGTWLPARARSYLTMDRTSLATVGASLGAGVLVELPEQACGLVETARVVRWLASETAGQCGPCVFGLASIAGGLDDLVWGRQAEKTQRDLQRWLTQVRGRGACHHPDGAARLVDSCLKVFDAEIAAHARHGGCPAVNHPPVLPLPPASRSPQWR